MEEEEGLSNLLDDMDPVVPDVSVVEEGEDGMDVSDDKVVVHPLLLLVMLEGMSTSILFSGTVGGANAALLTTPLLLEQRFCRRNLSLYSGRSAKAMMVILMMTPC